MTRDETIKDKSSVGFREVSSIQSLFIAKFHVSHKNLFGRKCIQTHLLYGVILAPINLNLNLNHWLGYFCLNFIELQKLVYCAVIELLLHYIILRSTYSTDIHWYMKRHDGYIKWFEMLRHKQVLIFGIFIDFSSFMQVRIEYICIAIPLVISNLFQLVFRIFWIAYRFTIWYNWSLECNNDNWSYWIEVYLSVSQMSE